MLLDVKAPYRANFKRKPARNFGDGILTGVFTVAIPEVAARDVTPAVTFGYRHDAYADKWKLTAPRTEVMGVEYQGKLYFPFERKEDGLDETTWLTGCCEGADGPFRNPTTRYVSQAMDTDDRVVAASGEERAAMAAFLAKKASETLLVDGKVWHVRPEPFLEVVLTVGDDQEYLLKGEVRFPGAEFDPGSCYRLDQFDQAVAEYREALREWKVDLDMPEVQVFDASLLTARYDERHLLSSSLRLLHAMKKDALEKPASFLVSYANLRDEIAAFKDGLDGDATPDADPLMDAVREAAVLEFDDPHREAGKARGAVRRIESSRNDASLVASMTF